MGGSNTRCQLAAGQTINLTYQPGQKVNINAIPANVIGALDAEITNITDQVDFIYESPDWPGASDDSNLELLAGGLQSVDDTSNFTSIFTPDGAGTGCITPEPATLTLLGLGLAAASLRMRRRRR
jgi:hypothetical protein